jgi:hypothetical protein
MSVSCGCCVLSGREKSLRSLVQRSLTESVCVCVSLSMIRCNNNPLHLQLLGRRGQTKIEKITIAILRKKRQA